MCGKSQWYNFKQEKGRETEEKSQEKSPESTDLKGENYDDCCYDDATTKKEEEKYEDDDYGRKYFGNGWQ